MSENKYYKNLPKKRMGAGMLFFNNQGELLIVKPVYKDSWSIPGGVVDDNESPQQACVREVKEEINLDIQPPKFLGVDYVTATNEKSENLQFVFYGGILDSGQIKNIKLPPKELSEYKFLKISAALPLLGEKMQKRISPCLNAIESANHLYLENGVIK